MADPLDLIGEPAEIDPLDAIGELVDEDPLDSIGEPVEADVGPLAELGAPDPELALPNEVGPDAGPPQFAGPESGLPLLERDPILRVAGAAIGAVTEPFEQPFGMDEETHEFFQRLGVFPPKRGEAPTVALPIQQINHALFEVGAGTLQVIGRSAEAIFGGILETTNQGMKELGVETTTANQLTRDLGGFLINSGAISGTLPIKGPKGLRGKGEKPLHPTADRAKIEAEVSKVVEDAMKGLDPVLIEQVRAQTIENVLTGANTALRENALDKMHAPTTAEVGNQGRFNWRDRRVAQLQDRLDPIKVIAERGAEEAGKPVDLAPYHEMRLLAGNQGVMEAVQKHGTIAIADRAMTVTRADGTRAKIAEGDIYFNGDGLNAAFEPMSGNLEQGGLYMLGRRLAELESRGIETGYSKPEIAAFIDLGRTNPEFKTAFEAYRAADDRMISLLEQTDVLSKEAAERWREAGRNYVPMYRVATEDISAATRGQRPGTGPLFKRIKGGESPVREIFDNIYRNNMMMVDVAMRNRAKLSVYDMIEQFGMVELAEKMPKVKITQGTILDKKIIKQLEEMGVEDAASLLADPNHPFQVLAYDRPFGPNVDMVFRDGKRVFYEVKDPELMNAMQAYSPKQFNLAVRIMGGAANTLRRGVTMSPTFLLRNTIRDTQVAFLQSEGGFVPVLDSVSGFKNRVASDPVYWEAMANGAGFSTLYKAETAAGQIRIDAMYNKYGVKPGKVANTAQKLGVFVEEATSSFETAARMGEYKGLRSKGASAQEAAMGFRDVTTDFGLRGSSTAVQTAAIAIPFANARFQSLVKMGKVAKQHPGRVAIKGAAAITIPTLLLYQDNKDRKEYHALPDWIKDQHWVIFLPGTDTPWLIPKGFEWGMIFGTTPERTMEGIELKHGKRFTDAMLRIATDTFTLTPIPQAARPIAEVGDPTGLVEGRNRSFTGAPILPKSLQEVRPSEQTRPWTSATMREMALILSEETGVEVSPIKAEALVRGYLGMLGSDMLAGVDMMVEKLAVEGERPTPRLDEVPVIGAFTQSQPYRRTSYEEAFYRTFAETRMAVATMSKIIGEGRDPSRVLDENPEQTLLALAPAIQEVANAVAQLRKAQRQITLNPAISGQEKRTRLDQIQREINEVFYLFAGDKGLPASVKKRFGFPKTEGVK